MNQPEQMRKPGLIFVNLCLKPTNLSTWCRVLHGCRGIFSPGASVTMMSKLYLKINLVPTIIINNKSILHVEIEQDFLGELIYYLDFRHLGRWKIPLVSHLHPNQASTAEFSHLGSYGLLKIRQSDLGLQASTRYPFLRSLLDENVHLSLDYSFEGRFQVFPCEIISQTNERKKLRDIRLK